jgi:hypothetical protein
MFSITMLSITHHTRKRPSTGTRTTHGPQSSRTDGCCAGHTCPSKVVEMAASGLADEDACVVHPHHVEAAPQWSRGWELKLLRQPEPLLILRQGRSASVAAAGCRDRSGNRRRQ